MSSQTPTYPKRLIEVDLPIKKISEHARREKSIRHGHISTLHIWWARRPLAACRAVICASLWPDPADPLCPEAFVTTAREVMDRFWNQQQVEKRDLKNTLNLRQALLDFIADFANWDNSTKEEYINSARELTQAAHESLEGAKEAEERFDAIARSIVPLHPATNDFCASETKGPTPVPTYKPRAIPTVKNTVKPTEQPTPVPTFVFKPISTPTPMPTQVYSATPMPTQGYAAAIIPLKVNSATPIPTQVYSATPVPTRTYSVTPIPTQYIPPITSYTGTCPCNCNGPDLNCKDFSSHAQAQACFDCCKKSHGDCFGLDRDGDGNVCESSG